MVLGFGDIPPRPLAVGSSSLVKLGELAEWWLFGGEKVTGLTAQGVAKRHKRGKSYSFGTVILEHGKVSDGDPDLVSEGCKRHITFGKELVEVADHSL